jgi:FKBP-type peptidyl-prolyl cis-trans isomerase SlyD
MKIGQDTVVTLRYKVSDAHGKLIEEVKNPMAYLHGGYGNTLPKIEAALDGQQTGYQTTVQLQPADAFGLRDDSLLQTIARKDFPPGVKVGGELMGRDADGHEHPFTKPAGTIRPCAALATMPWHSVLRWPAQSQPSVAALLANRAPG